MISLPEFKKKQIIFVFASSGDKLSFSNDNIVVKDKAGKVKHQSTCYKLFLVIIIGDISITSGLLKRANKFGFTICLMTRSMKVYQTISAAKEGNTLLHRHQYEYDNIEIGKAIISNKIINQRDALKKIRDKTYTNAEAIRYLNSYVETLNDAKNINEIMGVEGASAKAYFPCMFSNVEWSGRRPRIKSDYINSTLDIGYNILFNFVDAILSSFGFDTYYGVLHRCFYRRKSLVCDIVEPFRVIIDLKVRKGINLGQFKEEDFNLVNHMYSLSWDKSTKYVNEFAKEIITYKDDIFLYIQQFYRAFMRNIESDDFPEFRI